MSDSGDEKQARMQQPPDLLDLIWSFSEGTITDEDMARLDQLLLADPANRATYKRFMNAISHLEHELALPEVRAADSLAQWTSELTARINAGASSSADSKPMPAPSPGPLSSTSIHPTLRARLAHLLYKPWAAALCASLATVVAIFVLQQVRQVAITSESGQRAKPSQQSATSPAPIAYLSSATGYRWGDDSSKLRVVGSTVSAGEAMTLQEGIAEFRLSNGVRLSLEGPAGVVIASPDSLVLQYGKLTAYVPKSRSTFKVMAGASRLTTSSAAFGVDLSGGNVDVHVFAGEVAATNTSLMESNRDSVVDDKQQDSSIDSPDHLGLLSQVTVLHGRSLTLKDDRESVYVTAWGAADDSRFSTRLPLSEPLPISQRYVDLVKAARPAGYWRFESVAGDRVKNEIRGGSDVRLVGKAKELGNSENRVIELGGAESDGFLSAVDTTDVLAHSDYSVEVWLRPNHVHAAAAVTFVGESPITHDERPGFYLGLHGSGNMHSFSSDHPSVIRYLNRTPPSGDAGTGANCFSGRSYQVRRWQHVVAVKKGAETRLYLDGELVATANNAETLPKALRLIIGEASTTQRTYRFCGQLDELSIYEHALSDDEIRQHFRAVPLPVEGHSTAKNETI